jgi:glutamate-5-semialdehyde dehydrogenase
MSAARRLASAARQSSRPLSLLTSEQKNKALAAMASALRGASEAVLSANKRDVLTAYKKKMPTALVARLTLDAAKIQKIAASIDDIVKLKDPVGTVLWEQTRPNGLRIQKVRVPLGSILIIYESRPNVTADCMALCLKSGNAVILKGGSEAFETNRAMFDALSKGAYSAGVPRGAFQFVQGGREVAKQLLAMDDLIDLVIPRGGEGLIREVAKISKIPVIKHYKGVCHVYIDEKADLEKAERIVLNAKTQNPSVCNAMECLLVHERAAKAFLPKLNDSLKRKNVEVHADTKARALMPGAKKATGKDWGTEYLSLTMAVRVVKDLEEALSFIAQYGSQHSDAIVTEDAAAAARFTDAVDSSAVFVNASTRFNDGGEFGMGAEMGISTDKLHARGPMGLEELTSYKYVVRGDGQIRS